MVYPTTGWEPHFPYDTEQLVGDDSTPSRQRTGLEKALLVLISTLFFVIFALAAMLYLADHRIHKSEVDLPCPNETCVHISSNILEATNPSIGPCADFRSQPDLPCLNQTCVHIASTILKAMNPSIDPCADFYSYSCDGWVKANPAPDGETSWDVFMKLEQQNQLIIKDVIEQPIETLESEAERKAKIYYESCLDEGTIEGLGTEPMVNLVRELGGWNITDTGFDLKQWSFQKTAQLVKNKYHVSALFSYAAGDGENVVVIDQSGLTLPTPNHYLDGRHGKVRGAYLDYMTKVGVLLGGEWGSTRGQMEVVIGFERELANITTQDRKRRKDKTLANLMTIAELKQKAKFLNWRAFFENAQKIITHIVVANPGYLENLSSLIERYQSTVKGNITLSNYFVWQTVRELVGCLPKQFREARTVLRKAIGSGGEQHRWQDCLAETTKDFGPALDSIFVRTVFHPETKNQVGGMVGNIRKTFRAKVANLKWLDEGAREEVLEKVDAMSYVLGNTDDLDKLYGEVNVRKDTYFENVLNIKIHNLRKVSNELWNVAPATVNAYYRDQANQMVFPAGILQSPFYDFTFPLSLNYGGMGSLIGHEFTHAFDDDGVKYDKDGKDNNQWNRTTIEDFEDRTNCLVNQYNQYRSINGYRTLDENIADNGGLQVAYHAYLTAVEGEPEPPTLPGVPLNHRQLFFVAFAQTWCSSVRKGTFEDEEVLEDTHSPPKYRVIGTLSNFKEFSDVFGCSSGTNMNPERKCEVW